MKKIFALVLAMILVLGMTSAFAATISVTPPTGIDANGSNEYKIYKVFNVTVANGGYTYSLVSPHTTVPTGFVLDDYGNIYYGTAGDTSGTGKIPTKIGGENKYITLKTNTELTDDDIAAIKAYVANDTPVATATSTGTTVATATVADNGYYFITTTVGTAVIVNTTDITVNDKNSVPGVTKEITGASDITDEGKKALAMIGTDVEYTATITVGKGPKGYIFHDTMDEGLSYNNDVEVSVGGTKIEASSSTFTVGKSGTDSFTITFADSWIKDYEEQVITLVYSAKITDEALEQSPDTNDAHVTYGEGSRYDSSHEDTEVYNAKIDIVKKDASNNDAPLAGAGFKLKNSAGKFYHKVNGAVTWDDDGEEHTSGNDGVVPTFDGLPNGTYTLVETTVPAGYNPAADIEFTVASGDYHDSTNLVQTADVFNNKGGTLPSTGGIGTTLFYVGGGILVLAAIILLVTKKRMSAND